MLSVQSLLLIKHILLPLIIPTDLTIILIIIIVVNNKSRTIGVDNTVDKYDNEDSIEVDPKVYSVSDIITYVPDKITITVDRRTHLRIV